MKLQLNQNLLSTMPKYTKKPVEIEAEQWTGDNVVEILNFCTQCYSYERNGEAVLAIATLEGTMTASKSDMIIKGVQGEFYPCKKDIFDMTYNTVD